MTDAPKKRKNGRAKGKIAEREVAAMVAAWWAAVEPGCEFRSTPSSGGWATPQLRGHFKVAGDLTTTAKRWPFTVEVKRREAWNFANVSRGKASPVWSWWRQACKAADEESRVPILFLRKNSRTPEWFVILPALGFDWVPHFDKADVPGPGCSIRSILTSWDVLRSLPLQRIIKACRAYVSDRANNLAATSFIREVDKLDKRSKETSSAQRERKLREEREQRRLAKLEREERKRDPVKALEHLAKKAGGRRALAAARSPAAQRAVSRQLRKAMPKRPRKPLTDTGNLR